MELRHLRFFSAVADELHFARAAERLHIEQSPLSRSIKELEEELGVRLFDRTTRSTRLTHAGHVFLEHVPRVLIAMRQARESVKAVASGYRGQLRIALSDGIAQAHLTALLVRCRQEEPDVDVRLYEVPFSQQVKGLENDLYDAGLALSDGVEATLVSSPAWTDPIMVAIPAGHALLAHARVPLDLLLQYPLILCDPDAREGCHRQVMQVLRTVDREPLVAEHVASLELMTALVAAGFGIGFCTDAHGAARQHPGIETRPLAGRVPPLATYVLRRDIEPSEQLCRFLARIKHGDPRGEAPGPRAPLGRRAL